MCKQLVLVSTPYQILNVIALSQAGIISSSNADLLVVPVFSGHEKIAVRVGNEHLFASVRVLPKVARGEQYPDEISNMLACNRYEQIFCSFPHRALSEMVSVAQKYGKSIPQVILFDDGLGSYISDIFHDGAGSLRDVDVRQIYVSCPDMMSPEICSLYEEVLPLPRLGTDMSAFARAIHIFDVAAAASPEIAAMYLSQPFDLDGIAIQEQEIFRLLSSSKHDVLWRAHPRDIISCPFGLIACDNDVPWEILCATDAISDRTVLMGAFSTAQFTPSMLFGRFPNIVFLFELMFDDASIIERYRSLVEKLEDTYIRAGHAGKINVPRNFDELSRGLCRLSL